MKQRVRVIIENGTELGYYTGDVSLYMFISRNHDELRSVDHPEEKPDEKTIHLMAAEGFELIHDPDNPRIELDSGKVVYGFQVWWEEVE